MVSEPNVGGSSVIDVKEHQVLKQSVPHVTTLEVSSEYE